MADGSKHVQVFYSIVNDGRFADVYPNPTNLGTWLQLLLVADAMYPADAPIPAYVNRRSYRVLVDAGLVEDAPHQHYRMHGLARLRGERSNSARNAAAMRWQSERNAEPMPSRAEQSIEEQSRDAREDDDGRLDLEAFLLVRHRAPTPAQRRFLDVYQDVFDQTGPERAERLILRHPDDPIGALKTDLEAFRRERSDAAAKAEAPKPKPNRRPSGLTGINAELAKLLRDQEATA